MSSSDHERAAGLLAERAVEGLGQSDATWLEQHLAACPECSGYAGALGLARQALCSIPVTASDELVAATKARVRIRSLELRERTARAAFIGVSVCIGVVLSSISLYYAWPLVRWVETRFEVPALVVEPGFVLAWFLPTVIAAAMLAAARTHAREPRAVTAAEGGTKGEGYVE
jgi:hypothetical protein